MNGPVLILPGLYNSGPEHWQSYWERAHSGFRRVERRTTGNARDARTRLRGSKGEAE